VHVCHARLTQLADDDGIGLVELGLQMTSSMLLFWAMMGRAMGERYVSICTAIGATLWETSGIINVRAMTRMFRFDILKIIEDAGGKACWTNTIEGITGVLFKEPARRLL
jgi:hypothetical protein